MMTFFRTAILQCACLLSLYSYGARKAPEEVNQKDSGTELQLYINDLRSAGGSEDEISEIEARWFKRGYWSGSLDYSGHCHPKKIDEFRELLRTLNARIAELERNRTNPEMNEEEGVNQEEEHPGREEEQQAPSHAAETLPFTEISDVAYVESMTQEACQQAVRDGVINKEGLFVEGIGDNTDESRAIDSIVKKVRQRRVVNYDNQNKAALIRILIARNSDLFKDVEFVREIKDDLKKFHSGYCEKYNEADSAAKKGHPYLRFLIIDKI